MHIIITSVHVLMCVALILVVLLQTGKGADMGAAFGGSSQTVFGSSGAGTFLGKMTTVIAVVFMLTSLWLAYFAAHKTVSIIEGPAIPAAERTIPADDTQKADIPVEVPAAGETQEQ
ncbi:MAG: preprotein translocase subunit SecG [Deltaproteobacteria bacterium]|nr:preprotein translocase subunit SecG [Deltaproteobacteria bacterium]MBN2844849.1 preprotein translocase subunit SecG [Deltaproteobacteria bacterium]